MNATAAEKHGPPCKRCTHDETRHELLAADGSRGRCLHGCGCEAFVSRGAAKKGPRLVQVRGHGASLPKTPAPVADMMTVAAIATEMGIMAARLGGMARILVTLPGVSSHVSGELATVLELRDRLGLDATSRMNSSASTRTSSNSSSAPKNVAPVPPGGGAPKNAGDVPLSAGEQRTLVAIAAHGAKGTTRQHVTIVTRYKRSARDLYVQRLVRAGMVCVDGGRLFVTAAGAELAAALHVDDLPRELPIGERRVLEAIARSPRGVTREQLTILTGYKRSTRDLFVQRLIRRELVNIGDDKRIKVSDPAVIHTHLGEDFKPLPRDPAELRDHWISTLPEGEANVLAVVAKAWPAPITRDAISETTGYKRSTRDLYLQKLVRRSLVAEVARGAFRASRDLFEAST